MQDIREELEATKRAVYGTTKHWDAANLKVTKDGNWINFFDPKTNKRLNSPRLKNIKWKVSYYAKPREVPKEPEIEDPLDIEKHENYTSLPCRPLFTGCGGRRKRENIVSCQLPNLSPKTKEFKGNTPLCLPLRFSTLLLNEKRENEAKCYTERKRTAQVSVREPKTPKASLFRRSLKRDELEFKWGEGVEKMAKSLYKKKQ